MLQNKLILLFMMLILSILLLLVGRASALKPASEYWAYPSDYGIIYEEIQIKTKDNLSLNAWFIPSQDTTGIRYVGSKLPSAYKLSPPPDKKPRQLPPKKPTIIIPNGDAGNMSWLIWYAHKFFPYGYNVLLFDWRGFGESSSWEFEKDIICVTEFLIDLESVIEYAKVREDVDPDRIVLFGYSTGAYLIFGVTKDHPEIAAIGVRSLLSSFDQTLPLLQELSPHKNLHFPPNYPKNAEPIFAAEKIKCPVFMVTGEYDFQTPPSMAIEVFRKLEGNKLLWIAKNAEHGGSNGPEYRYTDKFFPIFRKFIKNVFSGYNYARAKVSCNIQKDRIENIVNDLAFQAGFRYDWLKSVTNTDSLSRSYISEIKIENKPLAEALKEILQPHGLTYKIQKGSIVIYKK